MNNNKIILIDSNSLINRAFHALPPLQLVDGTYTNAIYGYTAMLQKLISEEKPTHICAVFDCKAKTFRHYMYDGYKATRKPMAEELAAQIPILKDLLEKMGIKILFKEGAEADDIIGTLAKRFDDETIIVTGDRDSLQLIDDTTTVFLTKRGVSDVIKYTPAVLKELEGFTPEQIIEYKGLAGDSSDNIPGAPGVGQKTATDLLTKFGNIDNIYANVESIVGKLKERLENNKELVYLSKQLATIDTKIDLICNLDDIKFSYPLPKIAYEAMKKLDFKKLIDRFKFDVSEGETVVTDKFIETEIVKINDETSLVEAINEVSGREKIAVSWDNEISFSDGKKNYVVNITNDLFGTGLTEETIVEAMRSVFEGNIEKIVYDAKQIMTVLSEFKCELNPPYSDLALKGYLLSPGRNLKDVKQLLSAYGYSENTVAANMYRLDAELDEKIDKLELTKLYRELELPLVKCLFDMERVGFRIDINILNELDAMYTEEIEGLVKSIYELAGEEFNVNSNKQLASILFEKLGLPHSKKNKTGFSVNAEVLEELEHPIAEVLLRYRQLTKLKSTYIDGMRGLINKSTGKVHTCFKQNVTATGRLSSTEPNLQNIPVRRAEGREIRRMFVPSDGCVLVSADYSQIELRLLAHFSQDSNLIEAFKESKDIHATTASKIFRVPFEEVTSAMRSSAKAVNFGIIYGISSFGLAKNANVTNYQAKKFMEEYFATYPAVKEYMNENIKVAKEQGYLRTMLGRIRYFPELTSSQYTVRAFGERAAMNMPLQGSASDIIKLAMLKVKSELEKKGLKSKLILQVHDELILDVPEAEEDEVKGLLVSTMENVVELRVPLIVNVASGKNWYEAK